jgi:hypothetical protein
MKAQLLGLLCLMVVSVQTERPALANNTASINNNVKISTSFKRVAACLPEGSSCSNAGDCCSGFCRPRGKCGR